jgi:hypothetical protein
MKITFVSANYAIAFQDFEIILELDVGEYSHLASFGLAKLLKTPTIRPIDSLPTLSCN